MIPYWIKNLLDSLTNMFILHNNNQIHQAYAQYNAKHIGNSVSFKWKKSAKLQNYVRHIHSQNSIAQKKSSGFGNFLSLLKFSQFC